MPDWESDGVWYSRVSASSLWNENTYYTEDGMSELSSNEEAYQYWLEEKDGIWSIYDADSLWSLDAYNVEKFEFDQKEQEADTPKVKAVLNADRLIYNYLEGLVTAINYGDFDDVKPYLLPDSELYKSQESLV